MDLNICKMYCNYRLLEEKNGQKVARQMQDMIKYIHLRDFSRCFLLNFYLMNGRGIYNPFTKCRDKAYLVSTPHDAE
jgi:hypothetical protein